MVTKIYTNEKDIKAVKKIALPKLCKTEKRVYIIKFYNYIKCTM